MRLHHWRNWEALRINRANRRFLIFHTTLESHHYWRGKSRLKNSTRTTSCISTSAVIQVTKNTSIHKIMTCMTQEQESLSKEVENSSTLRKILNLEIFINLTLNLELPGSVTSYNARTNIWLKISMLLWLQRWHTPATKLRIRTSTSTQIVKIQMFSTTNIWKLVTLKV